MLLGNVGERRRGRRVMVSIEVGTPAGALAWIKATEFWSQFQFSELLPLPQRSSTVGT